MTDIKKSTQKVKLKTANTRHTLKIKKQGNTQLMTHGLGNSFLFRRVKNMDAKFDIMWYQISYVKI